MGRINVYDPIIAQANMLALCVNPVNTIIVSRTIDVKNPQYVMLLRTIVISPKIIFT